MFKMVFVGGQVHAVQQPEGTQADPLRQQASVPVSVLPHHLWPQDWPQDPHAEAAL